MPEIKFTDTNLRTLSADRTTWFSDPSIKGLQLCVTAGGVKTWYLNKWDTNAQKTRRVKLGQWAAKGTHCRWAKEQVGRASLDVIEGRAQTKQEAIEAKSGIPTFREALELFLTHRTAERASGNPTLNSAALAVNGSDSVVAGVSSLIVNCHDDRRQNAC